MARVSSALHVHTSNRPTCRDGCTRSIYSAESQRCAFGGPYLLAEVHCLCYCSSTYLGNWGSTTRPKLGIRSPRSVLRVSSRREETARDSPRETMTSAVPCILSIILFETVISGNHGCRLVRRDGPSLCWPEALSALPVALQYRVRVRHNFFVLDRSWIITHILGTFRNCAGSDMALRQRK